LLELDPPHRRCEAGAGESKARIGGVQRYRERRRNLGHRAAIDLVQDEDGPLFEREGRETAIDELLRLSPLHRLLCARGAIDHFGKLDALLEAVAGKPTMARSNSKSEGKEPGSQGSVEIARRQATMDLKKYFVRKILSIRFAYPETPERSPHVRELLLEERIEVPRASAGARWGGHLEGRRTSHHLAPGATGHFPSKKTCADPHASGITKCAPLH
jgi:hypothetical protein